MLSILKSIICREFEHRVRKGQFNKEKPMAMDITFDLKMDYSKEDGNRWLDIRIYAPGNYVGVIARVRSNYYNLCDVLPIKNEYDDLRFKKGKSRIKETTEWVKYSYHDSCWREDGVNRVLQHYEDQIEDIDTFSDWYTKHEMSEQDIQEFRTAIDRR